MTFVIYKINVYIRRRGQFFFWPCNIWTIMQYMAQYWWYPAPGCCFPPQVPGHCHKSTNFTCNFGENYIVSWRKRLIQSILSQSLWQIVENTHNFSLILQKLIMFLIKDCKIHKIKIMSLCINYTCSKYKWNSFIIHPKCHSFCSYYFCILYVQPNCQGWKHLFF